MTEIKNSKRYDLEERTLNFAKRVIKLGCLRQRLLGSPLEGGAGGVLRQIYTPLYPLFLEGNYKR
jgi:hypothetical protein